MFHLWKTFVYLHLSIYFAESLKPWEYGEYYRQLDDPYQTKFPLPSNSRLLRSFSRNLREFSLQMKKTLRFGLNQCGHEQNKCQQIGIVGAGASGLFSGILLAEAGHNVTIYEANNRAGGRIYTYRDPSNPSLFMGEMGAMRFPLASHPYLNYLITHRYNLTIKDFYSPYDNSHIYMNGILTNSREFAKNPDILGFNITQNDRGKSPMELWTHALEPILTTLKEGGWEAVRDKWDSYSIDGYLKSQNLSWPTINYLNAYGNGETYSYTSILETLHSVIVANSGSRYYSLVGGSDALSRAMVADCQQIPNNRCSIVYSTPIVEIQLYDTYQVRVQTQNGTNELFNSVIVATTAPAAELIRLEKRTDFLQKINALRQLHILCLSKVLLFFNVSWWESEENLAKALSITDLNIKNIFYPDTKNGGTLIAMYANGFNAVIWQSLSESNAIQLALRQVMELHPTIPMIKDYFQGGKVHHWCNDPFAHMAVTRYTPFQDTKLLRTLQMPVANVYFVGEYTSSFHGWIESALISALRGTLSVVSQSEIKVDVIIVGGDPIGLLTAVMLSLKHPNLTIMIIEQNSLNDWSSTTNIVDQQQLFRRLFTEYDLLTLANVSSTLWHDLEAKTNVSFNSFLQEDNGFLLLQHPNSTQPSPMKYSCDLLRPDCQYLTNIELHQLYPSLNITTQYDHILLNRSNSINMTELMGTLMNFIKGNSKMILREHEEILSIQLFDNQIRLITDRGILHSSGKVIFIHDLSDRNISDLLNLDLNLRFSESPVYRFNRLSNSDPLPSWIVSDEQERNDLVSGYVIGINSDSVTIRPKLRKNRPDSSMNITNKEKLIDWVSKNFQSFVNTSNYTLINEKIMVDFSLSQRLPLGYVPHTNERMLMYLSGIEKNFLPVWADILSDLALDRMNNSSKYINYMNRLFPFQMQEENHTTTKAGNQPTNVSIQITKTSSSIQSTTQQSSTTSRTNEGSLFRFSTSILLVSIIFILERKTKFI